MLKFKMKFDENRYKREVQEQMKKDMEGELKRAGLSQVQIKITNTFDKIKVSLEGEEGDVKKAQKIIDGF